MELGDTTVWCSEGSDDNNERLCLIVYLFVCRGYARFV